MKKSFTLVGFLIILIGVLLSGCTSSAGIATSWPGLAVSDEVAYVAFGDGVYAVSIQNGNKIWSYPAEPNKKVMYFATPAISNDMVVVGNYNNELKAINSKNGLEQWGFNGADDRYIAGALIYDGKIYAPNADSYLYVLDKDGELLWRFKTQKANWAAPVTNGKLLFLASMDHSLYALDLDYQDDDLVRDEDGARTLVGKPIWSVDLGAAIFAEPLISDSGEQLFIGTLGGRFYSVDATNGKILWSFNAEGESDDVWSSPVLVGNKLFFGDANGKIYALSVESGNELWPSALDAGSPIIGGGVVMPESIGFPTVGGKLVVINKEGKTLPTISLDGKLYTKPVFVDGKQIIAITSGDQLIVALDENGREYWSFKPTE